MSQAPKSAPNYIVLYHEDVTGCAESVEYVTADYARQLERENAALREALQSAENGLRHALMIEPLDPFKRGKIISEALDVVRAAIDAARAKEAKS
jgi:hypothetical protein